MELNRIISWLYHYSQPEQELRDYYETHGTIISGEADGDTAVNSGAPPRAYENDLRGVLTFEDFSVSRNTGDGSSPVFKEPLYFSENSDVFISKHPRYSAVPMHKHQFFEIVYVYEGYCEQTLSCLGYTRTYTMKEGDFLFIPANQEHAITVDSDSIVINIGLRTSTFERTFLHNIPQDSILGRFFSSLLTMEDSTQFIIFHTDEHFPCKPYVHQIFMSYCNGGVYAKNLLNLQLSLLFLYLLQEYSENAEIINGTTDSVYQIPALIAYMEKNYSTVNIKSMAKHFGYSTDHLNRIFKQWTGQTISEALMRVKMEHAVRFLENPRMTVSDVAESLGYKDMTNFIRNFKKYYGVTPKAYRSGAGTVRL